MSFPRSIVHLDADAFFASVEQAADPRLRGQPIAVGGEKRGIIASASYEARKFGIYTPMPTMMARRLCPKLILLPGDFEKYELFSRLMFSYAYDFTPDVEIGSIDEGYFDLTGTRQPAVGIAQTIRQAIRQSLKLPVSEGIAGNKLVSQIASKLKKPSAFEVVPNGGEAEFLSPLANKWLPGVGPKTAGQLNAAGLAFIGQIAQTPIDLLNLLVGSPAPQLRRFALGIDERPIVPVRAPAQSYGTQETFAADTTDEPFLEAVLRRMADSLMAKVRADGKSIRTLTVKVRYNDMDEEQASESLNEPTDLETDIYAKTSHLLRKAWRRRVSLRLVSLKLSNVYDSRFCGGLALEVTDRQHAAQQRLAGIVDELREKYGRAVLLRGHDFMLRTKGGRGEEPGDGERKTEGTGQRTAGSDQKSVISNQWSGADGQESVISDQKSVFRAQKAENRDQTAETSGQKSEKSEIKNRKAKIEKNASPPPNPTPAYHHAVVERQRLGSSFARVAASPGVELRFRMELQPPANGMATSSPSQSKFKNQKSKISYVPLNVHSYYSFLDSTLSVKAIVDLAKRHELPAIALTDRNNLHGAVEFAQAAAEAGIKPIIGAELDWHGRRLCLYVQNQTGYQNLCRILSQRTGVERRKSSRKAGQNPPVKRDETNSNGKISNAQNSDISDRTHCGSRREEEEPHAKGAKGAKDIEPVAFEPIDRIVAEEAHLEGSVEGLPLRPLRPSREDYSASFRVGERERASVDRRNEHSEDEQKETKETKNRLAWISDLDFGFVSSRFAGEFRISDFNFSTDGLIAVSPSPELAPFFPGRFYLEVSSLDAYEKVRRQSTNPSIHQSINPSPSHPALPCVASFPVHYELPSDRWKYNIVQSIRTLTLLRQPHPEKRLAGDYHFRPLAEMRELFAAHPELLANSLEIADRCAFTFSLGKPQFPSYPPPDGSSPAVFLRRLVMEGLQRRYPDDHARLKPQLEEELAIIMDVGYEEYFLVMWDILQECRRRGIEWITRGSAADSLACYCLEISSVCPIRFDLYFRRFLNKERMALNKLPDIDVDFPHDRKDDVIDLIFERYGPHHAAVVGGFSTFQSRSAFAEVAKVLGVSEYQVRRLTERLPHFSRPSELAEAVAGTLECRDLPLDQEPYSTALQMAQFLDGFPRYPKMHPCGLVLSRQNMDEITPCFISAKGYPTTHFDMDSVEAVGLIKMDILAQGGLAVMRDVQEMLKAQVQKSEIRNPKSETNSNEEISNSRNCDISDRTHCRSRRGEAPTCPIPENGDSLRRLLQFPGVSNSPHAGAVSNISNSNLELVSDFGFRISDFGFPSTAGPFDDPKIWDLIASGSARAVHHIESPAMISLCRMCNVRDIDTLIAIVSVIRPGAANESKKMEFARRYQGLSPVRYPHPSLEPCLRSTYGLVVYEEHILQICEAFAGLPPGRADVLRRALGKDKIELIDQIQIEFADCARRRGRTEAEIAEVWGLVAGFRGYAFCKAHSTAYGVEAYQSAWLKLHYPAEFMAAVLTNGKGFYSPLVYVLECHRLGIPLLPPSVNEPGPQFTVTRVEGRGTSGEELKGVPPAQEQDGKAKENDKTYRTNGTDEPHPPSDFGLRSSFSLQPLAFSLSIRVPVLLVKGLTNRTKDAILRERARNPFSSLTDFVLRVQPLPEEMEALIRVGAFDEFGQSRTSQYWEFKRNAECGVRSAECQSQIKNQKSKIKNGQLHLLPSADFDRLPSVPLVEPTRLDRLRAEEELLGYPVSGHPLELFPDIDWDTYCPVNRLGQHLGEQIVTCGLVIEQRLFHQVTGEPMKFITIADWTGIVETELFAKTYQSYGLNTVRYRVLEITATVEPFENGRGHTLRVLRAGKPRTKAS